MVGKYILPFLHLSPIIMVQWNITLTELGIGDEVGLLCLANFRQFPPYPHKVGLSF